VEAAAKYKRVVQHGTQMRSSEVTAKAAEVIASGVLGEVKTAKAWNCQLQVPPKPAADGEPPPGVDYDLWLGPAPKRPFNPNRFHRTWQLFRDYGNGDIGNDGIHDLDMARWGLGETTHPVRVTAHGSRVDLEGGVREWPDNMQVTYEYASGRVLIYEDRQWTPYGLHGVDSGNAFYGTKGYMIFSRRGFFRVLLGQKEEPGPAMGEPGRVSQPAPVHLANFLDCVRTRKPPNAPAEAAHLSCGLTHLGNIAQRTGRVLRFDPTTETFPGDREATALLTKEYRKPWGLPA
jgi:predicted dehydrogenase